MSSQKIMKVRFDPNNFVHFNSEMLKHSRNMPVLAKDCPDAVAHIKNNTIRQALYSWYQDLR